MWKNDLTTAPVFLLRLCLVCDGGAWGIWTGAEPGVTPQVTIYSESGVAAPQLSELLSFSLSSADSLKAGPLKITATAPQLSRLLSAASPNSHPPVKSKARLSDSVSQCSDPNLLIKKKSPRSVCLLWRKMIWWGVISGVWPVEKKTFFSSSCLVLLFGDGYLLWQSSLFLRLVFLSFLLLFCLPTRLIPFAEFEVRPGTI